MTTFSANNTFIAIVSHWEVIPAREGDYRDIPDSIDRRSRKALASEGISRFDTHQHDCYQHINSSENKALPWSI